MEVMQDNSEVEEQMETATSDMAPVPTVKDRPILLASVIIMGVLIVLGFIVVFGTIIYRVTSGSSDVARGPIKGVFGAVDVPVAPGANLLGTTLVDDKLSIVTAHDGIVEVILFDTKRGVELGRVRLVSDGVPVVNAVPAEPAP
ncbi:MAG: hypothetical protein RLN89_01815 [Parvibaculum sp.]